MKKTSNKAVSGDARIKSFPAEMIAVADLRPHPRNYRTHLPDQIEHISESICEHGFYRNVVVSQDNTILAGHGVVESAKKLGVPKIPVIRLNVNPDDPRALKVLTGDNEISRLAEVDDRALTEMLKSIKDTDVAGLLGTGFDEKMLAALVMVTRPASEIQTFNEAAEWVGLPERSSGSAGRICHQASHHLSTLQVGTKAAALDNDDEIHERPESPGRKAKAHASNG